MLEGDVRADVAVVGGGYTGLSAALHLAEAGVRVRLLESVEPGWGASGRNGGQVNPGLHYDPDVLESLYGPDLGPRVVRTVAEAPDLVFSLIAKHGMDCESVREGWIQAARSSVGLAALERRVAAWSKYGAAVSLLGRESVSSLIGTEAYIGGALDRRSGMLQPLSYARGLAAAARRQGVIIHSQSEASELVSANGRWLIRTPRGSVEAESVILATNAHTDYLWPGLKQSVMPVFSYQVATAPLSDKARRTILPGQQTVAEARRVLYYFRVDASGRLVFGGRGPFRDDPRRADIRLLSEAIQRTFPQIENLRIEFFWTGRVAMTRDHLPHLHELAPGLHAGLGYNGRGVAMATAMGRLLALRVLGKGQGEIDFPISKMLPVPLHALHRIPLRGLIGYSRFRDRLDELA